MVRQSTPHKTGYNNVKANTLSTTTGENLNTGTENEISQCEKHLTSLQNQLAKAVQSRDTNRANALKEEIDAAQKQVEAAKFNFSFSVPSTASGVNGRPHRLSALNQIVSQLIRFTDIGFLGTDNTKLDLLQQELASPIVKEGAQKDLFLYALHAVVLLYIRDRETYGEFIASEVLPSLREIIRNHKEYNVGVLEPVLYAFTVTNFFMCLDTEDFESGIKEDISLVFKVLKGSSDERITVLPIPALAILVFYLHDWNEMIEKLLPKLVGMYDQKSLNVQAKLAQLLAWFYHLYDFTDQFYDASELSIASVDNSHLLELFKSTLSKTLQLNDQDNVPMLEKCASSIERVASLSGTSGNSASYLEYERRIMEHDDSLQLTFGGGTMPRTSWLRVLMFEPWAYAFKSFFVDWMNNHELAKRGLQSTSLDSILQAKEDKRNGIPRY